jgi:fructose-1,6-bisphosphatase I
VLEAPERASTPDVREEDFLQPGSRHVAVSDAVYGSQRSLVPIFGKGGFGSTLDREVGSWVLTQRSILIPEGNREFAVNMSNHRHCVPQVRQCIDDRLAGQEGPCGQDFNMRCTGWMVADIHRILNRSGIFFYPWDAHDPARAGNLHLLYEANPLRLIIEQAGCSAIDGTKRILHIIPGGLHDHVSVVTAARDELEAFQSYGSTRNGTGDAT